MNTNLLSFLHNEFLNEYPNEDKKDNSELEAVDYDIDEEWTIVENPTTRRIKRNMMQWLNTLRSTHALKQNDSVESTNDKDEEINRQKRKKCTKRKKSLRKRYNARKRHKKNRK